MKLACIIVTKDRLDDLRKAVATLAKQTVLPEQIIIIDSSNEPILREQLGFNELPILLQHSSPGITLQRNLARSLVAPDADVVLYIDDDVTLPPTTLALLATHFESKPNMIGLTGNMSQEDPVSVLKRVVGFLTLLYTSKPYGVTTGLFNLINRATRQQTVAWLPGAFMAWRWKTIRTLAFDEWFTHYGLAEDFEFSQRAAAHGQLIVDPEIVIHHHHSTVGRDWTAFGYMRIINRRYLLKKYFWNNWQYRIGFWWSTLWLLVFNVIHAIVSKQHQEELMGNFKGLTHLSRLARGRSTLS